MATSATRSGHHSWAVQALTEVGRRLADVVHTPEYTVRVSAFSSPTHADVPVFHGFQDDVVRWVQLIDSLAACHAWPGNIKRSIAEERLRDAAWAWNVYDRHTHLTWASWSGALIAAFGNFSGTYDARYMETPTRYQGRGEDIKVYIYDKLRLLVDCGLPWLSPAARQYVIDGLADPAQAAILTLQPPDLSLQDFIDLAVELHLSATRQAQEPHLQASLQTPEENHGPGPALNDTIVEEEEATTKVTPIGTGEGATCAESPYQACNQPTVPFLPMEAFLKDEPPLAPKEGSGSLSRMEGRSPPSLNLCLLEAQDKPMEGDEQQDSRSWSDKEISPELKSLKEDEVNSQTTPKVTEGGEPRPKFPEMAPKDNISFTVHTNYLAERFLYPRGCDETINMVAPSNSSTGASQKFKEPATIPARPDEDDQTDMSGEASNHVASDIETDGEKTNEHKNAPVTHKWAAATVVEEVNGQRQSKQKLQYQLKATRQQE